MTALTEYHCLVTGEPIPADAHLKGQRCICQVCKAVAEIEELRVMLEAEVGIPHVIMAENQDLQTQIAELQRDLKDAREGLTIAYLYGVAKGKDISRATIDALAGKDQS